MKKINISIPTITACLLLVVGFSNNAFAQKTCSDSLTTVTEEGITIVNVTAEYADDLCIFDNIYGPSKITWEPAGTVYDSILNVVFQKYIPNFSNVPFTMKYALKGDHYILHNKEYDLVVIFFRPQEDLAGFEQMQDSEGLFFHRWDLNTASGNSTTRILANKRKFRTLEFKLKLKNTDSRLNFLLANVLENL